jgi:signal transduction histidine kinase
MLIKKIKASLSSLLSADQSLVLENRLFLSTIIIGVVVSLLGTIVSFILSSSETTIAISVILFFLLVIIYYLVRFKKMYKPFVIPLIVISYIGISIIWIYDGGINGSDLIIAFVIFILSLIIAPDKSRKYFLALFIVLIVIIYFIQRFRPYMITSFPTEEARWTDSIITAVYCSYFIFLIIQFLLRHYTLEKQRAEEGELKLRRLNADKDMFISILAHDLKNPFQTILGLSELIMKDIDKQDIKTIEKHAEMVNSMSQRTFNLLEDLLLWARSQSGKLDFKPEKIDFVRTCHEAVDSVIVNAHSKNIEVKYSGSGTIDVIADRNMIKAVLRNLISNAIKFTNPGGQINIHTELSAAELNVTVSDTGIGIVPERISKLFDITDIESTTGTSMEKGTGLGLLLCKEFVEKHGGTIRAESTPGKGSDFKFTLPVAAS